MNNINNLVEKMKAFFMSNAGKVMASIFGISLILTFILATMQNNAIAISFIKSIISGLIVCIIIYIIITVLKKSLKDDFPSDLFEKDKTNSYDMDEKQKNEVNGEKIDNYSLENNENSIKNENTETYTPNSKIENTTYENKQTEEDKEKEDTNIDMQVESVSDNINDVDKISKVDYHNTGNDDDISSIIFANKSPSSSNSVSSSSSSGGSSFTMFDDSPVVKPKNANVQTDNPEMLVKAVRTMRARDNEKTKDKS